mgnify:CR=1 FL=1
MCSGAVLLYGIPRVIVGENQTFRGPEDYVRSQGVQVEIVQDETCIRMMREFIATAKETLKVSRDVSNAEIADLSFTRRAVSEIEQGR